MKQRILIISFLVFYFINIACTQEVTVDSSLSDSIKLETGLSPINTTQNNVSEILIQEKKINSIISSLKLINKSVAEKNKYTYLVPILVAFLAGLLALLQVKANIISTARIEWTQSLRGNLSCFLSEAKVLNVNLKIVVKHLDNGEKGKAQKHYEESLENFKKTHEYGIQIKLFLNNQKENEHRELQDLVKKYFKNVDIDSCDFELDKINILEELQDQIIENSQKILKQAWEDAKTFKARDIFKFKF